MSTGQKMIMRSHGVSETRLWLRGGCNSNGTEGVLKQTIMQDRPKPLRSYMTFSRMEMMKE